MEQKCAQSPLAFHILMNIYHIFVSQYFIMWSLILMRFVWEKNSIQAGEMEANMYAILCP